MVSPYLPITPATFSVTRGETDLQHLCRAMNPAGLHAALQKRPPGWQQCRAGEAADQGND